VPSGRNECHQDEYGNGSIASQLMILTIDEEERLVLRPVRLVPEKSIVFIV
jgi:hypothetical protein